MVFSDIDFLQRFVGNPVQWLSNAHLLQGVAFQDDDFVGQTFQIQQYRAAVQLQAL